MKKILLPILIISAHFLYGQSNYQKGIIVLNSGDSVKGFIDYKEWTNTPASITFKSQSQDEQSKDYGISDIQYFEVSGFEYFKRFTIPISLGETKLQNLSVNADTSSIVKTVFLSVLQEGKNLILLSYKDNIKTRFYLLEKDGKPEELVFRRYYSLFSNETLPSGEVRQVSKKQVQTSSVFRNQLYAKSIKYNVNIGSLISKADYDTPTMLKFVSKINGIDQTRHQKLPGESGAYKARFFVGGGVNLSSAKFDGVRVLDGNNFNQDPFANFSSDLSIRPKVSFGIDLMPNPNIARSVFRLEFIATQFVNKMNLVETRSKGMTDERQSDVSYVFTQNTITFAPQFIYHFYNAAGFKFYAGFGLAYSLAAYPKGNAYKKVPQNPIYSYEAARSDNFYDLDKYYISVPITAGLVVKKHHEISFKYFHPFTGITTQYVNFSLKVTSVQLDYKYLIIRKKQKSYLILRPKDPTFLS